MITGGLAWRIEDESTGNREFILVASVALVTDDILTAEYTVDFKKTHSQTLLPMLDEIVKLLELDMDTIDAIAVAGGRPGAAGQSQKA